MYLLGRLFDELANDLILKFRVIDASLHCILGQRHVVVNSFAFISCHSCKQPDRLHRTEHIVYMQTLTLVDTNLVTKLFS